MRIDLLAGLAIAALAAMPGRAAAQDAGVPGVQFAGCWRATTGSALGARSCVIPSDGGLRIVTVDAAGGTTESVLQLDGARHPVDDGGCVGWEQSRLSRDGERVVIDAELTCGDEPRRRRTTTLSITPSGHWLQATGSGLAQISNAELHVFAPAESYADVPEATRRDVMPFLVAAERARTAMRDAKVSAADLRELDAMEVATPLIDVLVAASYPKSFILDASGGAPTAVPAAARGNADAQQAIAMNQLLFQNGFPMLSMYDWGAYYSCMRFGGFSCPMNYFGWSRLGFMDPYGYWLGGWGYGPGVTVVVRPTPTTPSVPQGGGRAVRGSGYTQTGDGGTHGTAQPRASTGSSFGSGSGAAHSGGASSAGSASSGSSSGGGQRTAKPRDP